MIDDENICKEGADASMGAAREIKSFQEKKFFEVLEDHPYRKELLQLWEEFNQIRRKEGVPDWKIETKLFLIICYISKTKYSAVEFLGLEKELRNLGLLSDKL